MANYYATNVDYYATSVDLSAYQFLAMKLTSSGVVDLYDDIQPGVNPVRPIGILNNRPGENSIANVQSGGIGKIVAAAPINVGEDFTIDTAGRAKQLSDAPPGMSLWIFGKAETAASSAGDIIECLINIRRMDDNGSIEQPPPGGYGF